MPQNRYFIALDTPGTPRMRPTLARLLVFALAALACAPAALAWGNPAHRVAAELAQAQLRPGARAEVDRLLAGEAEPTLAGVSGWADEVREDGGQAGRRTRRWHYVDFHAGCDYEPARDCPDGDCLVSAIDREVLALSDRARPDAERELALKYLVHLVADAQQPLHSSPNDDKGGLEYQLKLKGKGDNLHIVWDVRILERVLAESGLDEAAYARSLLARAPLPADPTLGSAHRATEWAQESCRIVRDGGLYPPRRELGDYYLDLERPRMEERLRLAGARLADVLNAALDPGKPQ